MGTFIWSLAMAALFFSSAHGFGYMNTMSVLWGQTTSKTRSYGVCNIEAETGHPHCWGTYTVANNSRPPANVSLWSISGGAYFSCGLRESSHTPVCWGQTPGSAVPESIKNLSYNTINCGGWHACAIRSQQDEGQVDCWGNDDFEQFVDPNARLRSISAGDFFTCGISETASVSCWGQISSTPDPRMQQYTDVKFEFIAAGRAHVCGITSENRTALCWGSNDHGQSSPPIGRSFSAITAGMSHTCGIRLDNHQVQCWGDNELGQSSPPEGVRFSVISAGDRYTCGVEFDGNGAIHCWGNQVYVPVLTFKPRQGICSEKCTGEEFESVSSDQCRICHPCARCGSGTFTVSECGPQRDTVCDDCRNCTSGDPRCSLACGKGPIKEPEHPPPEHPPPEHPPPEHPPPEHPPPEHPPPEHPPPSNGSNSSYGFAALLTILLVAVQY